MSSKRTGVLSLIVALSLVALAGAGCQALPGDSGRQLAEKDSTIAQLQAQIRAGGPALVIQAGQLEPAPAPATPAGWDTEASLRGNIRLVATYDSSGAAAWDPVRHPLVFITSEGHGYAGTYSETYKAAGLQIIDANTKRVIASAAFDLGFKVMGTPHGLGLSPDGQWIYVPTNDGDQPWTPTPDGGRLLVVNARTLKLDRVLGTPDGPHHVKAFVDWMGRDRVIVEAGQLRFLLDPNDDHRVVMSFGAANLNGLPYQTNAHPNGKYLYSGLVLGGRAVADRLLGAVAKMDLETGRITYITGVGMYPNGFAFSSDSKFTYVADSSGSRVYKIDNTTDTVVASTQSGVPGPYNITLNWDETELWVIGKGEMTFNLGGSLGLINTRTFTTVREYPIGGQTIDHNILSPDRNANELWVTSSGTLETIVFDLAKREVKARIPSANGGDTHSGAFVRYGADFAGELLADQGGVHQGMLADRIAGLAAPAGAGSGQAT